MVVVTREAEMAECHRKELIVVWLWLLRRYLDAAWAILEAKSGVVLQALAGRRCEAVGNP